MTYASLLLIAKKAQSQQSSKEGGNVRQSTGEMFPKISKEKYKGLVLKVVIRLEGNNDLWPLIHSQAVIIYQTRGLGGVNNDLLQKSRNWFIQQIFIEQL